MNCISMRYNYSFKASKCAYYLTHRRTGQPPTHPVDVESADTAAREASNSFNDLYTNANSAANNLGIIMAIVGGSALIALLVKLPWLIAVLGYVTVQLAIAWHFFTDLAGALLSMENKFASQSTESREYSHGNSYEILKGMS